MKSTRLLASWAAVSVVWLAACSSSNKAADAGSGGSSSSTGGSGNGGSAGNASGGKAGNGTGGGAAGGGVASGGTSSRDGGDAGTADGSSAGGGPTNCQADLQNDKLNCGRCGKSCAGGDCVQGLCEAVLVMDVQYPAYAYNQFSGFVSQGKVYEWEYTTGNPANNADSYVFSTPTANVGSPPSKGDVVQDIVVNAGDVGIDAVTFDPTYAYEAIEGTPTGAKGQVARKKLDRSEPTGAGTKVFSLPGGPNDSDGNPTNLLWQTIAVGSDAIYLTGTTQLNGFSHPTPDTTTFYRMALPLGADATKEPVSIVTGRGENITDLAVFGNTTVGQHLFWLEYNRVRPDSDAGPGMDYFAFTVPAAGGTPVLLDDVMTSASAFASDGSYVYWTEINDLGRLMRCPLANLDVAHVSPFADVANAQEGIALQGPYVYTMELSDPGPVFRVNTATGAKELLGNRAIPPSEKETNVIGVDANFVYLAGLDAKIWRLPNVP